MMINAAYGTAVLFSAYLILNTINPDLVKSTFNLAGLPATQPATTTTSASCLTAAGSSYSDAVTNVEHDILNSHPELNTQSSPASTAAFIRALIVELKNNGYTAGYVGSCDGKGTIPLSIMVGFKDSDKDGEVCTIFDSVGDGSDGSPAIQESVRASCTQHAPWAQLQEASAMGSTTSQTALQNQPAGTVQNPGTGPLPIIVPIQPIVPVPVPTQIPPKETTPQPSPIVQDSNPPTEPGSSTTARFISSAGKYTDSKGARHDVGIYSIVNSQSGGPDYFLLALPSVTTGPYPVIIFNVP